MDVVRHILMAAEDAEPWGLDTNRMDASQWDKNTLGYHAQLLIEAGFLKGEVTTPLGSRYPEVLIDSPTWEGHDFLDAIRDDTVWNKTKSALLETTETAALEVVKALAVSIARSSLGLPPA